MDQRMDGRRVPRGTVVLGHGGLPISGYLTRRPGGGPACLSRNERALLLPSSPGKDMQARGGQVLPQLCLPPDTFIKLDFQPLAQWPVCVTLR